MYDFYFGTEEDIEQNQEDYLVFIKRLLPRWVNSIPDSEYLAVHRLLNQAPRNGAISAIVETGVGASTLVLLNHVFRTGGVLYSWDINGSKAAFLRSVINDTLVKHYGRSLWDHWKFIPFSSVSDHLGIGILSELGVSVDFCFLDSEHTKNTLIGELERTNVCLCDGALVVIDDANYSAVHTNTAYINMQRAKLGLAPVHDPHDNRCEPFYREVEAFLKDRWHDVGDVPSSYKDEYSDDIFFSYFSADRRALGKQGMEKFDALENRLGAWRVSGRKEE